MLTLWCCIGVLFDVCSGAAFGVVRLCLDAGLVLCLVLYWCCIRVVSALHWLHIGAVLVFHVFH